GRQNAANISLPFHILLSKNRSEAVVPFGEAGFTEIGEGCQRAAKSPANTLFFPENRPIQPGAHTPLWIRSG
ncbi:hypothetical protein, partial [Gluconacetobacter sp.]|uniref:hypothetical protein n=1 Tax=Gluconacetobacter sp. TaxID=1935994 RepID=UPI0039E8434C